MSKLREVFLRALRQEYEAVDKWIARAIDMAILGDQVGQERQKPGDVARPLGPGDRVVSAETAYIGTVVVVDGDSVVIHDNDGKVRFVHIDTVVKVPS